VFVNLWNFSALRWVLRNSEFIDRKRAKHPILSQNLETFVRRHFRRLETVVEPVLLKQKSAL
jgi:hypothetical protein